MGMPVSRGAVRAVSRLAAPLAALLLVAPPALSNLLVNPGFESGSGHGQPPPAPWQQAYVPGSAGSVTTSTAARTGTFGVWAYTNDGSSASYSHVYQDVAAQPGSRFRASFYARTAPVPGGGTWVEGSTARLRLSFLTALAGC